MTSAVLARSSEAARHLARVDPVMRRLTRAHPPFEGARRPARPPFESLARAIAHQQLNGTAAATILARFTKLFTRRRFPRPADLATVGDESLRGAGFSRAKIAALRDLAARTLDGTVPPTRVIRRLDDGEIVERLTQVRGVGRWSVEMLLIFQLGRPDVLPVDDFGVRNGYRIAYQTADLPRPGDLLACGERWRPHRTAAAWYLWRAADSTKAATRR